MEKALNEALFIAYMSPLNRLKNQITEEQLHEFRSQLLDFINEKIVERFYYWDIIITIHRKGEFVFKDLTSNTIISEKVLVIGNHQISEYKNYFEDKNVLLFDDSINTTDTIQNMINKIKTYNINSLSVATIVVNASTYKKLIETNKDTQFIAYEISSNYMDYFLKLMCPYFDYICLPATKDLIIEKITIFKKLSYLEIIGLFSTECFTLEREESLFQYKDRFKLILDFFNEPHSSSTPFSELLSDYGFQDQNISQTKIRFFVHVSDSITQIYVEYIVEPVRPNFENCYKSFERIWCTQRQAEQTDCLICFQYNFTEFLKNYIRRSLESKKMNYELESLPWIFCEVPINTGA